MQMQQYDPYRVLGMNPGRQQAGASPAGETLPSTSHSSLDSGALPWHPDSPAFWVALIGGATLLGVFGASFRVRVAKGSAGANIGKA